MGTQILTGTLFVIDSNRKTEKQFSPNGVHRVYFCGLFHFALFCFCLFACFCVIVLVWWLSFFLVYFDFLSMGVFLFLSFLFLVALFSVCLVF